MADGADNFPPNLDDSVARRRFIDGLSGTGRLRAAVAVLELEAMQRGENYHVHRDSDSEPESASDSIPNSQRTNYLNDQQHNAADVDNVVDASQTEEELASQSVVIPMDDDTQPDPPAPPPPVVAPLVGQAAPEPPIGQDPKGFHWHAAKGHFTYKGWLDHQLILDTMSKYGEILAYSIVWENGDSAAGYQHTHAAILWKKTWQKKNCATAFDVNGIHPHIKVIQNQNQWTNTIKYHKKAPVGGPWISEGLDDINVENPLKAAIAWVQKPETKKADLYSGEYADQISTRLKYFQEVWEIAHKPKFELEWDADDEFKWQLACKDLMAIDWASDKERLIKFGTLERKKKKWAGRSIVWIWGPGNIGKSFMAKYAASIGWCMLSVAKVNDLAYIASHCQDSATWPGFVFDFGRAVDFETQDFKQIIAFVEKLKDGTVLNGKYEPKFLVKSFYPIIVFANKPLPNDNEIFVTADRLSETTFEIMQSGVCAKLVEFVAKMK